MKPGWEKKKLGDLCRIIGGGTPSKEKSEYYGGPIPWATVRDMQGDVLKNTEFTITNQAIKESSTNIVPRGNVVIATRVGLGKVCLLGQDTAINQDLRGIIPLDFSSLAVRFLFFWLKSVVNVIIEAGTGATVQGVKLPFLKSLMLPLPPLPEQQRIVGILDEAFENIALATVNAETNLKNASALFESHLNDIFSKRGDGWMETTIGEQIRLQRGFDITKELQREGHVPVVSSGGIKSFHDTPMVRAPGVVIGRKGTLGKVFYLEKDYWPHDTTLWVKEFNGNLPRFVYHFLTGIDVHRLNSGAANPALNRNQVHPIRVFWPQLSQQKILATQLDALAVETQRLASIYHRKLAALDELKKSLLHRAFTGQL